uniref:ANK_REP_REGION domain-containing protein n=1 Tax=Macrostomum lignano TaxID=282301 RepID=A0A1I8FM01_9PLAT
CMHWLLWHGADATVTNPRGWTPVSVAAIRGQDACMQALITRGASVTNAGSRQRISRAAHGNSFTLQTLLRAGAVSPAWRRAAAGQAGLGPGPRGRLSRPPRLPSDAGALGAILDEGDSAGNTPRNLAAMEGHLPVLKFIVTASGNSAMVLGARNDHGETRRCWLSSSTNKPTLSTWNGSETNPEEAGEPGLPRAPGGAHHGDLAQLRSLVENGIVNVNERDDHGSTPAHKAAGQGHIDALQGSHRDRRQRRASRTTPARRQKMSRADSLNWLPARRHPGRGRWRSLRDGVDVDDVDDMSDPPYGNTEGDSLQLTPEQIQQAQAGPRKKIDELRRLLLVAEENYKQLGGKAFR